MAFDVGDRAGTYVFVATLPSCELRSYWRFTTSIHEAWLFLYIGTYVAVQLASDDHRWQLTRLRSVVALGRLTCACWWPLWDICRICRATLSSREWRNYLRTAPVSKKVDCCRHVNKLLTNNTSIHETGLFLKVQDTPDDRQWHVTPVCRPHWSVFVARLKFQKRHLTFKKIIDE